MENSKYINNITLECLLNPTLYDKINGKKLDSQEEIINEISFYRKRICHLTKEMSKGNYVNNNFKNIFINYAGVLVYYLKQNDEKDIYQEEYKDLDSSKNLINDPNDNNIEVNLNNSETNKIIMNKPSATYNLDNFVKKINVKQVGKILPKERIADIKNPDLKTKGLKR